MCGVPHHAVTAYVGRLVKQGFRVALCEQMEDPRTAKGVVKREVVRVVTPGTQLEASALEAGETAFVLALAPGADRARRGLARRHHRRVRGGGVGRRRGAGTRLRDDIGGHAAARAPACRAARTLPPWLADPAQPEAAIPRTELDDERLRSARRRAASCSRHFGVLNLEAFGCESLPVRHRRRRGRPPLRARHAEARPHPRHRPPHPRPARTASSSTRLTRRNLELVENLVDGSAPGHAARRPRPDAHAPWARGGCASGCCGRWPSWSPSRTGSTPSRSWPSGPSSAAGCGEVLGDVQDLDRILGRVTLGTASPRDLARAGPLAARAAGGGGRPRGLPGSPRPRAS